MRRFTEPRVVSLFKSYPPALRTRLMALRELVLDAAAATAGVGPLTETLKWGQPSYLTEETGSGTTVRIDRLKSGDGYALYFHCRSGLIGQFRELYPDTFTYEGKRAIVFGVDDRVPARELRHCLMHIPSGWNQPDGMCSVIPASGTTRFRTDGTACGSIRSEPAPPLAFTHHSRKKKPKP